MKPYIYLLTILLIAVVFIDISAQDIPLVYLVYDIEHTGTECETPPLPLKSELPIIKPLTDPFEWSDGRGRDTTFKNWYFQTCPDQR